jgi:phosphate/sulfate permease
VWRPAGEGRPLHPDNGSGLQGGTLRNIALAWVLTLPAAIALAGGLYWLLRTITGG